MNEVYSLRLDHYMDDEGIHYRLEEPLLVRMIFDRQFMPTPVVLNSMLDKMRNEILRRAGETDGTD